MKDEKLRINGGWVNGSNLLATSVPNPHTFELDGNYRISASNSIELPDAETELWVIRGNQNGSATKELIIPDGVKVIKVDVSAYHRLGKDTDTLSVSLSSENKNWVHASREGSDVSKIVYVQATKKKYQMKLEDDTSWNDLHNIIASGRIYYSKSINQQIPEVVD